MRPAVFLTGGNQLRLSSVVAGTRLADAIHRAHDRGAVLAGTSAGASAMATHMMAFGRAGETPKQRMAQLSAGLGILQGVVVDQHFEQRGRFGRLLAVVAQSPSLLGIGLDEDTSAIVYADRSMEVVGKGAVTVVDGSSVQTDAHQAKGHRPIMISGAVLHSLPDGSWFDLRVADAAGRGARHGARGLGVSDSRTPLASGPPAGEGGAARGQASARARPEGRRDPGLPGSELLVVRPRIRLLVDLGALEDWPSNTIPGFVDGLIEMLPGVGEHSCSLGRRGGFGERLRDGTWLGPRRRARRARAPARVGRAHLPGQDPERGRARAVQRDLRVLRRSGSAWRPGELAVRLVNHLVQAEPRTSTSWPSSSA